MAMAPTVTGEPLTSLEYVREHILKIQDPKLLKDQNMEILTRQTSPVLLLLDQYRAVVKDGDQVAAAAIMDQMIIMTLTQQVQGSQMLQQLMQMTQGQPPLTSLNLETITPNFQGPDTETKQSATLSVNGQTANPGFGAPPATLYTGLGNEASPVAGQNSRGPSNTGLLGSGAPLSR